MWARGGSEATPILSPDNYNLSRGLQMSPIMSTHILPNHRHTHPHTSFRASGQYYRKASSLISLHHFDLIIHSIHTWNKQFDVLLSL